MLTEAEGVPESKINTIIDVILSELDPGADGWIAVNSSAPAIPADPVQNTI